MDERAVASSICAVERENVGSRMQEFTGESDCIVFLILNLDSYNIR